MLGKLDLIELIIEIIPKQVKEVFGLLIVFAVFVGYNYFPQTYQQITSTVFTWVINEKVKEIQITVQPLLENILNTFERNAKGKN